MTEPHMALVPQMRRQADRNPTALALALFRGRNCDWITPHCTTCAEAKAAELVAVERGGCTFCGSLDHPGSGEDDCVTVRLILDAVGEGSSDDR